MKGWLRVKNPGKQNKEKEADGDEGEEETEEEEEPDLTRGDRAIGKRPAISTAG